MGRIITALALAPLMLVLSWGNLARAQEDQPPITPPLDDPPPITAPAQGPDEEPPPAPQHRRPVRAAKPGANPVDGPVVRAEGGNMGMYFLFGGLAGLTHSNVNRNIGALVFNRVGIKFAFSEKWMLPIWFGTGLRVDSVDAPTVDATTDWGIDLGVGFEYHFRIWRRISPFLGAGLGFDIQDQTGSDNFRFGMGFGPTLGVEYYIGDRVSLSALYMFIIQLLYQDHAIASTTTFGLSTLAGGAVTITYYF
jgi:hypothetical protein